MTLHQQIAFVEVYIHIRTGQNVNIDAGSILLDPFGVQKLQTAVNYAAEYFNEINLVFL